MNLPADHCEILGIPFRDPCNPPQAWDAVLLASLWHGPVTVRAMVARHGGTRTEWAHVAARLQKAGRIDGEWSPIKRGNPAEPFHEMQYRAREAKNDN